MIEAILDPVLRNSFTAKGTTNKGAFMEFKAINMAVTQANGGLLTEEEYVKGLALFFKTSGTKIPKVT